jgi:hypothetical protein
VPREIAVAITGIARPVGRAAGIGDLGAAAGVGATAGLAGTSAAGARLAGFSAGLLWAAARVGLARGAVIDFIDTVSRAGRAATVALRAGLPGLTGLVGLADFPGEAVLADRAGAGAFRALLGADFAPEVLVDLLLAAGFLLGIHRLLGTRSPTSDTRDARLYRPTQACTGSHPDRHEAV